MTGFRDAGPLRQGKWALSLTQERGEKRNFQGSEAIREEEEKREERRGEEVTIVVGRMVVVVGVMVVGRKETKAQNENGIILFGGVSVVCSTTLRALTFCCRAPVHRMRNASKRHYELASE